MKGFAHIVLLPALLFAAVSERATCAEAPEPIRTLFEQLKASLPAGWEIAYLGEAPGAGKLPASLRFAFAIKRTEKVKLTATTISSPRDPETALQHLELIVYPEGRRVKKGLGWHPFEFRHKHFSLREPFAGFGTYEVSGGDETSITVRRELSLIKKMILTSDLARSDAARR